MIEDRIIVERLDELRRCDPTIIAIGASAGAIETLNQILPCLPADFPASVVIVVHLPADRQSALPELFGHDCALRVQEAEDKVAMEPASVYLAPPGYHLLVESGGVLSLSIDDLVNFSRPSIDVLFESVAHAFGRCALGILLTGASGDGAAGLARIRRHGGLTWVQTPESARARLMPDVALSLAPHPVLDPTQMAQTLARWRPTWPRH